MKTDLLMRLLALQDQVNKEALEKLQKSVTLTTLQNRTLRPFISNVEYGTAFINNLGYFIDKFH